MSYDKFFKDKFDKILKFIQDNKDRLDTDPEFKQSVSNRIKAMASISTIISHQDAKTSDVLAEIEHLNMKGAIKLFSASIDRIVVLAKKDTDYKPLKNETVLDPTPDTSHFLASLMEAFDATIIGIE